MNKFKELKVWQKGINLVTEIYKSTQTFPKEEVYGLTSQIRWAAVSIPSNIARGSSFELETQLIIALNLSFINPKEFDQLNSELDEIQRMITGLQNSLNR